MSRFTGPNLENLFLLWSDGSSLFIRREQAKQFDRLKSGGNLVDLVDDNICFPFKSEVYPRTCYVGLEYLDFLGGTCNQTYSQGQNTSDNFRDSWYGKWKQNCTHNYL